MNPAVGQSWSLLVPVLGRSLVRAEHRVEEVNGRVVVLRSIENGKTRTVSTSVLVCGRRGARLVRGPDGVQVQRPTTRPPPKSHPQARRAAELLADGIEVGAVAERFGVSASTVRCWASIVRREQRP